MSDALDVTIKRYHLNSCDGIPVMDEELDGEWVKLEDVDFLIRMLHETIGGGCTYNDCGCDNILTGLGQPLTSDKSVIQIDTRFVVKEGEQK